MYIQNLLADILQALERRVIRDAEYEQEALWLCVVCVVCVVCVRGWSDGERDAAVLVRDASENVKSLCAAREGGRRVREDGARVSWRAKSAAQRIGRATHVTRCHELFPQCFILLLQGARGSG